jgi:hypothetical protein
VSGWGLVGIGAGVAAAGTVGYLIVRKARSQAPGAPQTQPQPTPQPSGSPMIDIIDPFVSNVEWTAPGGPIVHVQMTLRNDGAAAGSATISMTLTNFGQVFTQTFQSPVLDPGQQQDVSATIQAQGQTTIQTPGASLHVASSNGQVIGPYAPGVDWRSF